MKHAELALLRKPSPRQPFDFSGRWTNELKSTMDLVVTGTKISGKYVSAVSSDGGPTPPFDITGSVADDLISFTVIKN
jgi:hypothetical protein